MRRALHGVRRRRMVKARVANTFKKLGASGRTRAVVKSPALEIDLMKETPGVILSRYIAAIIGGSIFGAVTAEVINEAELLSVRLNSPFLGLACGATLLLCVLVYEYFDKKARQSKQGQSRFNRLLSVYGVVGGVVLLCILISLPFVWWGAIMTVAGMAKSGRVPF